MRQVLPRIGIGADRFAARQAVPSKVVEQPLWRITRRTRLYPEDKRLPADVAIAREEFTAMASILDRHLHGRKFIVGDCMTVADCVIAYVVDWANELHLIDDQPQLRAYIERMYARPKAPPRIAEAVARLEPARA